PAAIAGEIAGATLKIRTRVEWQCPDGEGSPRWTPAYTTVTHAVVHHTAGSNALPDWENEVRNIWYYHTFTNAWGDIGYNFLIDPNGVIYEGRAGGAGAIGAHFSCRNSNTVGVGLLGTFTAERPTDAALSSLKTLLAEITAKNSIDPTAIVHHPSSGLDLPTILGHRDGNVPGATCTITECPGYVLYSFLPLLRSELTIRPPSARRRTVRH
ncbi:MAG TPA: N-acetylmuramoyl-L-alanine amidase, partial [Thermoanaerobaculia bacterium]|nr:N-acetylmuramoyl-L-alanine amidase [Thermoanaerobaculia bacterium]